MEHWLHFARGPMFVAALAVLGLGMARLVLLNGASLAVMLHRTRSHGRTVAWKRVLHNTFLALRPFPASGGARPWYSLLSLVFHLGLLLTPLFLAAPFVLLERGFGVGWWALDPVVADWLTLGTIVSALGLLFLRVGSPLSRAISRPQDYFLLLLILTPFVTGYLAMHPLLNPWDYDATMLVHVLSGNLILGLLPFTKLSHVALLPVAQVFGEIGWHLRPKAGEFVAQVLGKENQPI